MKSSATQEKLTAQEKHTQWVKPWGVQDEHFDMTYEKQQATRTKDITKFVTKLNVASSLTFPMTSS